MFVCVTSLYEDAFTWADVGSLHDCRHEFRWHGSQTSRTAGVVQHDTVFDDVCDAVFEQCEHLGALVDAQTVARAEVLVDPHTHVVRLRTERHQHQDKQDDVSRYIAGRNRTFFARTKACTRGW